MLVIICVGAGIGLGYKLKVDGSEQVFTGTAAWNALYSSWHGTQGGALDAVVQGAANILTKIGLSTTVGITLMGVFIASFAGTTLDTTVRIQRYVIGELANDLKIPFMSNRWTATTFAVITAAALAFGAGPDGAGAKKTLAPVRIGQSITGSAGAAGCYDVSAYKGREKIYIHRCAVRAYTRDHMLGDCRQ